MNTTSAQVHKKAAYHHGDLRQQLVTATRLLVESRGPMGFSVAEAAREAGVSSAAPYRHFKDRGAMLQAVAIEGMNGMLEAFDAATQDQVFGSLSAISALGVTYVETAERSPAVFRLMFAAHEDEDQCELQEIGMQCFGRLMAQVAGYKALDMSDHRVRDLGFSLWTFVHGLAFLKIDQKTQKAGETWTLDVMIEQATRKLLGD